MTQPLVESAAAARLASLGITVTVPGPGMLELHAVPCCPTTFSKERTNLLLVERSARCHVFVDPDLAYRGPDRSLRKTFAHGRILQNWRCIGESERPLQTGLDCALRYLSSPLPPDLTSRLLCGDSAGPAADSPPRRWGALLQLAARDLAASPPLLPRLPAAWLHLVERLAASCAEQPAPNAALLWGAARPALLRAVQEQAARAIRPAGPLIEVCCATLAAGLVLPADADAQLVRLFAETRAAGPALFLFHRLDLLCSRSPVCLGALADTRVRGPAFLATADAALAGTLGAEPDLRSAVLSVRVPALPAGDRRAWLAAELAAAGFAPTPSVLAFLLRPPAADPLVLLGRLAGLPALRTAGRTELFPDDFPQDGTGSWPDCPPASDGKHSCDGGSHGNPESRK